MNYAKIIHDAWNLTTRAPKLKWLVFVPSFVAVIFFVGEIAWQSTLLSEELGFVENHFVYDKLGSGISFIIDHNLLGWVIFLALFIVLFQFFFPAWILSTLILSIRQKFEYPDSHFSIRQKILDGFEYFPRLFELNAIFAPFSIMSICLFTVTMYRYYNGEIFSSIIFPLVAVFFIISLFVNVFISFAQFYVVCEKCPVATSIKKSLGLVFLNFKATMSIILLMLLVNVRIIVNVIVVLGVPFLLVFALSFFAKSAWLTIAVFGVSIVGLILLALAAYLTSIIEVFSTAVWERAFKELRQRQEDEIVKTETKNHTPQTEN